jgi:hypothetical protein
MKRTLVVAVMLLFVMAVVSPMAVAAPPEETSGRMVFQRDDVADGLRKYRKEKDKDKRSLLLGNLARTQDPRVAVELGGLAGGRDAEALFAVYLLSRHFVHPQAYGGRQDDEYTIEDIRMLRILPDLARDEEYVLDWWKEHESELRRAAKLPR